MLQISKCEISSLLNILREIRDGSETEDLYEDAIELIEMLEAILGEGRMDAIGRNGNTGEHYDV
jgi:hypothetical protein